MRGMVALCLVAACGRIDFDPLGGDGGDDDDDAPVAATWVSMFTQTPLHADTNITTFTGQAAHVGDAIAVHGDCDSAAQPTSATVTAPGWSFVQLGAIVGAPNKWGTSFGAIAPDTSATVFTITWGTPDCVDFDELADEFTDNDRAGGTVTFEVSVENFGLDGDCAATLTTVSARSAIWGACSSGGMVTGTVQGFLPSANDTHDDWSEYRPAGDPAGTLENLGFTTLSGGSFVMSAAAIKSR